jgi:hypothetical protein
MKLTKYLEGNILIIENNCERRGLMKKLFILLLLVSSVWIISCSKKNTPTSTDLNLTPTLTPTTTSGGGGVTHYYWSRYDTYDGSNILTGYMINTKVGSTVSSRGYSSTGVANTYDSYVSTYDSNGNQTQVVYYDTGTGAQTSKIVFQWQTF